MPNLTQAQPSPRRESGVLVIYTKPRPVRHTLTARELHILQALVLRDLKGSLVAETAELETLADKLEAEALAQ